MNGNERQCPFFPNFGGGGSVTAGNGSSVAGPTLTAPPAGAAAPYYLVDNVMQVELYNSSATIAASVNFGPTAPLAVATANSYVLPPGVRRVISVSATWINWAAWGIGGTALVYATPGVGQ